MADPNQFSLDILTKMLKELQKQTSRYKDDDINERVTRSRGDGTITNKNIINDFKRLGREVNHNIEAIKNSKITYNDLKKTMKDAVLPVARMSKIYEEYKKNFKEYNRSRSDEFKKAADATLDQFQKMTVAGKSVSGTLNSLKSMQSHFNKSIENFSSGLENIDLEKKLTEKTRDMSSHRKELIDKIAKNKYAKKGTVSLEAELVELEKNIKVNNEQISGLNQTNQDYQNEYSKFVKEINNLHAEGIPVLEGMQAADIEYEKFMNKSNKEQEAIVKQLGKNLGGVSAGIVGFEAVLKEVKTAIDTTRKNLLASAKQAALVLATVSATQVVKDYNATKKYNVTSISPLQAGNMGMSQDELSTLIGQNKTFLRVAGNGDQNAMIDSGQFKELQNGAKQFGVYGKDAAELAAKFGNLQMQLGGSVDPTSIKNVMDDFKKMSDITDMTVDELVDFTKELNKNGTITALNQKYADKNEKDKQAAIREEITHRWKLNKYIGYSTEQLKQQLQLQTNSKYADITESIRSMVGADIAISNFKNTGGTMTAKEENLFKAKMTNSDAGLSAEDQTAATLLVAKVLDHQNDAFSKGFDEIGKSVSSGKGIDKAYSNMFDKKVMLSIIGNLNRNQNAEALQARAEARLVSEGANKGKSFNNTKQFGNSGSLALAERRAENVGEATDSLTSNFNLLGDAVTTLREKITGFTGNPLGQASGALLSLGKSGLEFAAATRMMQAAGGMGGTLGSLGSIGGMMSSVGNIAATVTSVLAVGSVSYAIGKSLKENYDKIRDDGSSRSSDFDLESGATGRNIVSHITLKTIDTLATGLAGMFGQEIAGLSEDQRNELKLQERGREKVQSLQSRFGDINANNSLSIVKDLINDPQGLQALLSKNNIAPSFGQNYLGASEGFANKLNKDSIRGFIQETLINNGATEGESVKILLSLDSTLKTLTNETVKTNDINEMEKKAKEIQANASGSILNAIEERVKMTRLGVNY